jgi:hypothetical protein
MAAHRVEIRVRTDSELHSSIAVLVNGEQVGGGYVGGEPEDNSIHRDYAWIVPTMAALGKAIGADVSRDLKEVEDVDD